LLILLSAFTIYKFEIKKEVYEANNLFIDIIGSVVALLPDKYPVYHSRNGRR
jgi:hypothetical protein